MTQRPRYARVACCVPFCRRGSTRWPPPYELLCGDHYRLADKSLRRARMSVRRRLVKLGEWEVGSDGSNGHAVSARARRLDELFWAKIKRQAITRAGGAPA